MVDSKLIERIEEASGPDRTLDVLIGAAVRHFPADAQEWLLNWAGKIAPMPRMTGRIAALNDNGDPSVHWEAPAFTGSLDAAMTLVGDDCFRVERHPMYGVYAFVGDDDAYAPTPALALVLAALRSRSSS